MLHEDPGARCVHVLLLVLLQFSTSQNIGSDQIKSNIVDTKYGKVQGFVSPVGQENHVQVFLGVPYASPPTGNYRLIKPYREILAHLDGKTVLENLGSLQPGLRSVGRECTRPRLTLLSVPRHSLNSATSLKIFTE